MTKSKFLRSLSRGSLLFASFLLADSATAVEGFYNWEEAKAPHLTRAYEATGNIQFTWPSSCSGFYVSETHFLTALHCLGNCKMPNGDKFVNHTMGQLYQNMSSKEQKPVDLVCSEASLRMGTDDRSESIRAKVIAVGNGAAITRAGQFRSAQSGENLKALEVMKGSQSDWALLEISRPSKSFACVRKGDLQPGEKVWGIGFPAGAERSNHSSDGKQKYVTSGEHNREGFRGNQWLAASGLESAIINQLENFYGDRMHWVDSDAYTGMSGGGIFDSEGHASGVYAVLLVDSSTGTPGANQRYYGGSNGYLKMSHILAEAELLIGAEQVQKVFKCIR